MIDILSTQGVLFLVLSFLILGLSTKRVSVLVTLECGPFDIFKKTRERASIAHFEDSCEPGEIPHTFWGKLLSCPYCSSIWIGLILLILWLLELYIIGIVHNDGVIRAPFVLLLLLLPLSLSAFVMTTD